MRNRSTLQIPNGVVLLNTTRPPSLLIMTLNEMAVRMLYKVQRVRIPIRELDYHRLDIRQ